MFSSAFVTASSLRLLMMRTLSTIEKIIIMLVLGINNIIVAQADMYLPE